MPVVLQRAANLLLRMKWIGAVLWTGALGCKEVWNIRPRGLKLRFWNNACKNVPSLCYSLIKFGQWCSSCLIWKLMKTTFMNIFMTCRCYRKLMRKIVLNLSKAWDDKCLTVCLIYSCPASHWLIILRVERLSSKSKNVCLKCYKDRFNVDSS